MEPCIFAVIGFGIFCYGLGWLLSSLNIYLKIDRILGETKDLDTK